MKIKTLLKQDPDKYGWLEGLKERHGDDVEVSFTPFDSKSFQRNEDGTIKRNEDGSMPIPLEFKFEHT